MAGRVAEIRDRVEEIKAVPVLVRAALLQDVVSDALVLLADMAVVIDRMEGARDAKS